MSSRLPSRRTLTTGGLASVLLAGCSSPSRPEPDTSATPLGGAEPSVAPEPSAEPTGAVASAGYAAEGLVADAATGLLAVGVRRPDRILVLQPETLEVVRSIRVPGSVRHLGVTATGGTVLVPNEGDDTLVEADLRTGRTRTTAVGHVPHDATGAENGDVLVGDEFGGSMTVVRDGEVVHTFDDLDQPGGVVAVGDHAVVVDVADFSVTSYDLRSMERIGRAPAGDGPTHGTLAGPDRVAVADTRGGRLLLFSVDALEQVASLDLGASPYGLAGDPDGGLVWVTLTASNEVVGVDVAGDRLRVVERFPTVQQPNTVAVFPGSSAVFVASRTAGTVQRIAR